MYDEIFRHACGGGCSLGPGLEIGAGAGRVRLLSLRQLAAAGAAAWAESLAAESSRPASSGTPPALLVGSEELAAAANGSAKDSAKDSAVACCAIAWLGAYAGARPGGPPALEPPSAGESLMPRESLPPGERGLHLSDATCRLPLLMESPLGLRAYHLGSATDSATD